MYVSIHTYKKFENNYIFVLKFRIIILLIVNPLNSANRNNFFLVQHVMVGIQTHDLLIENNCFNELKSVQVAKI